MERFRKVLDVIQVVTYQHSCRDLIRFILHLIFLCKYNNICKKKLMNAPTARSLAAKAPEKGSFPLDHGGTCKIPMKAFQNCIKNNKGSHAICRDFSKKYLTCRMDNNLMAKEDLSELGFTETAQLNALNAAKKDAGKKKETTGFIAGMNIKGENR